MPTLGRKGKIKRVAMSGDSPSANASAARSGNKCSRNKHNSAQRGVFSASSPASRVFHSVGANMARAIRHIFAKKRSPSSNGGPVEMVNIQSGAHFVPHRDSHHSEAFEDCIEFINSSYRKSL